MKRRSILQFGFTSALVASLTASCGLFGNTDTPQNSTTTNPPSQTTKTVKVAANLPLTGALGVYGSSVRDGSTLAIEDLEKSNPAGIKLNFDWQDNTSDPKSAVTIFQKQYINAPDIYVSGVKPQTFAIKDQVTAKNTPHFVWIFDVFINKNSKNNFRTWVNYKIEPPIYLNYAKQRGAKRVAIVYVQLPHTVEAYSQILVPELKKQGVGDVFVEAFEFGKKDFKDIAAKVKDFNPDLIILNGFQGDLVALVRALRPFGLITDSNTIATYDMLDAATILGKDELEGIRVIAPTFVTRSEQPQITEFKQRFKTRFNREALYTDAFAYDMVSVIYDSAKRLTLPAKPEQWLEAIRTTNIQGVTGSLKFDADGDLQTPLEIGVFQKGKLVPLTKDGK